MAQAVIENDSESDGGVVVSSKGKSMAVGDASDIAGE